MPCSIPQNSLWHHEPSSPDYNDAHYTLLRAFRRKDITDLDAKWHEFARASDATFAPNGHPEPKGAELEVEASALLSRDVQWLRLCELPLLRYLWDRKSGFRLKDCDSIDAEAVAVIERYQRLWICLEQEASSSIGLGRPFENDEEHESALRSVMRKHRMAQGAATNDLYRRLGYKVYRWLDQPTVAWLLDHPKSPLKSLEQKMCLISEVQRFRDASYRAAEKGEYELGQMAKSWFRGIFTPRSGHLQIVYEYVDAWVASLEDMENIRGRPGPRMSAAMWLHERQLNGGFRIPDPLL